MACFCHAYNRLADRNLFDRLHRYKMEHGIATWDQALDAVLTESEERARV